MKNAFPDSAPAPTSAAVAALAAFTMFAACAAVHADVVVLHNGSEIQGEVLSEGSEKVLVRFPGGTLELKRKDIRSIQRQSRLDYLLDEARKAAQRQDFPAAVETLETAVGEHERSARAIGQLTETRRMQADHLRELNRFREALAGYRAVLASAPDDIVAKEGIADVEAAHEQSLAELHRGQAETAGDEIETGIWRLEKIHSTYPDLRGSVASVLSAALARAGRLSHASGDCAAATTLFRRAVVLEPETIDAVRGPYLECCLREIGPLVQSGDFASVEKLAVTAVEVDPRSATAGYYLALARDARGDAEGAASVYAAILGESPPARPESALVDLRNRAEAAASDRESILTSPGIPAAHEVLPGSFRQLRTARFTIHHRSPGLARELVVVLERAYADIFRLLACGVHWRNPCDVFIFPTQEDYLKEAGTETWSAGTHRVRKLRGTLSEHRIDSYQGQPRLTDGVLRHEVAHALLLHCLNYPAELPLWASEGFAVLAEPTHLHQHYRRAVAMARDSQTLIPVRSIVTATDYPTDDRVNLFYAQSFALVAHLTRLRGMRVFADFVRDIAGNNAPLDTMLQKHYGLRSILALETSWLGSL